MKNSVALFIVILAALTARSFAQTAFELFKEGKFVEADTKLGKNPREFNELVLKGKIALFSNDLRNARRWLERAQKLKSGDKSVAELLAETFYRLNDFSKSALYFDATERQAVAKKLKSFFGRSPYKIESTEDFTEIRFVKTDPLPLVKARINGGEELTFLIDTGGAELIIDTDVATRLNIQKFGEETGTFGGGRRAGFEHGAVESLALGTFTIKNIPINILKTQRFASVLGVKNVDGIIGSILLSKFVSTLDYPNERLILRKQTKNALKKLDFAHSVPFWMAGDHFLVAWGTVNQTPQMLFIDTGLAGMGFTAPESTLKSAGIKLENQSAEGLGGGGTVKIVPFVTDEITLGTVKREKIGSLAGAFPPTLENSLGFRLGGLVSHGFFRPFAVTFDFLEMRVLLSEKNAKN